MKLEEVYLKGDYSFKFILNNILIFIFHRDNKTYSCVYQHCAKVIQKELKLKNLSKQEIIDICLKIKSPSISLALELIKEEESLVIAYSHLIPSNQKLKIQDRIQESIMYLKEKKRILNLINT